ncbi:cupin-like domain-containing protein [Sphingomonas gilva]|uniref:Cupin-like domain-containing protein n=1 Tax=Sphingomonas gilva TaxID=2305907 RepID=A0A396RUZ1_9SPHN|nr:cupin-like domain-containing protein [Sphingomonas gilva]RHW17491.1 cupin-like domain-containing protein [Sphingomonas gilva]
MQAIPIQRDVTPVVFHDEIRAAAKPVVMKGLVGDWPLARAASDAEAVALLAGYAGDRSIQHVRAAPETEGRLHYGNDLRAPNFAREEVPLGAFLDALLAEAAKPHPDTLAVQGLTAPDHLPGFVEAHAMPLVPSAVIPRLWIGNAAKVATHHDPSENIACVAVGRRRFTLFPPDQVANLYMGPFHLTPAGTQVSMAHVTAPDLDRFPRFAQALEAAQTAELGPGDALYIPYQWYHHVEALDRVNVLVNYWWDPARTDIGSAWDALMHGLMTLRNLPADQRRAWRAMFDRYVFLEDGDPGEHLPPQARGILGATGPDAVAQMRRQLIAKLQRQAGGGR